MKKPPTKLVITIDLTKHKLPTQAELDRSPHKGDLMDHLVELVYADPYLLLDDAKFDLT
jgi:hypothetical protein